jgi:hypothetical protein
MNKRIFLSLLVVVLGASSQLLADSSQQIPVTSQTIDELAFVRNAINDFAANHADLFVTIATTWLTKFAAIALFCVGIRILFGMAHLKPSLTQFVITFLLCTALLRYYNSPLPWGGVNLHQLVTKECDYLASFLDLSVMNICLDQMHRYADHAKRPSLFLGLDFFLYLSFEMALWLLEGLMFALTASSFIFTGLCVVLGPLFIPMLMFPTFAHLFFKWLGAFLASAFLKVTAAAFLVVFCSIMLSFLNSVFAGQFTTTHFLRVGGAMFCLIFGFITGAFGIVKLNAAIFSGVAGSGTSLFGIVMSVVRTIF